MWNSHRIIEHCRQIKEDDDKLQTALNHSGMDSGESCLYWLIVNRREEVNQFWEGDRQKIHLAVTEVKKRFNHFK